ncbi:AAA family ATPase [Phenylobacterium sp. J426]|nr:AAA family ATPase [Phenylobacterium sp. J426]
MLAVRAGVRAHVEAHSGRPDVARAYVEAGIAHLAPQPAVLVAVGGLSGSGKSTFARTCAPALGASPGAVVLRTDEIRKRLLGVAPTQGVSRDAYTPEFYVQTYDALFANAAALLKSGRSVVLDATFTSPQLRARAETLAADCGVPFEGVWLERRCRCWNPGWRRGPAMRRTPPSTCCVTRRKAWIPRSPGLEWTPAAPPRLQRGRGAPGGKPPTRVA